MDTYILNVYNTCTGRYEEVEVTREVYAVYKRTGWNLEDDDKRFHKFQSTQTEFEGIDGTGSFEVVVDNYKRRTEEEEYEDASEERIRYVNRALDFLTEPEKFLITAIYFEDQTETEVAKAFNVRQQTLHNRKKRILRKLRKIILNFYAEKGCYFETSSRN